MLAYAAQTISRRAAADTDPDKLRQLWNDTAAELDALTSILTAQYLVVAAPQPSIMMTHTDPRTDSPATLCQSCALATWHRRPDYVVRCCKGQAPDCYTRVAAAVVNGACADFTPQTPRKRP